MSAEHGNQLLVAALLTVNVAVLVASALWAWRGGYLTGLDDQSTNLHPEPGSKENSNG